MLSIDTPFACYKKECISQSVFISMVQNSVSLSLVCMEHHVAVKSCIQVAVPCLSVRFFKAQLASVIFILSLNAVKYFRKEYILSSCSVTQYSP